MSAGLDPSALCDADAVGDGAAVGPYSVVERGARLGRDVVLGSHVVVRAGAELGDGVRVGDGTIVGPGVTVAAGARLGARAVLAGAGPAGPSGGEATVVHADASIGDGATIAAGTHVGPGAVVADGAVVDVAVPRHAVVAGNPAGITGYVGLDGPRALEPMRNAAGTAGDAAPGVLDSVVQGVQLHRMPEVADLRGALVAGELEGRLPFVPRRYFLVFDVPGAEIRGEHAHFVCHQFLVAVHGQVHVIADDGERRQEFVLDDRRTGVYLPPMVWGVQYQYSRDCVLMVLASHPYDPDDYIRDYGRYLAEKEHQRSARGGGGEPQA